MSPKPGTKVRFVSTHVTGLPIEYEEWFPFIKKGTEGVVQDGTTEHKTIIEIEHPLKPGEKVEVFLYPGKNLDCIQEI